MSTTNDDRASEIQRYELVSHGSYSMRYESMDEDPDGDWVKYDDHARMTTDLRLFLGQARGLLAEGDTDKADKMLIAALGVLGGEEG